MKSSFRTFSVGVILGIFGVSESGMQKAYAEVTTRRAPLPAKPRLTLDDLGVLERESQKFTAPIAAQQNPIPDPEAATDAGQATELTLKDAVRDGVSGATDVLKTNNDDVYAGEAVLQSYTQFLPTLDVSGNYSYTGGKALFSVTGPTLADTHNYGPSYSVSSSLNLFNGFADMSLWSARHERKNAAEMDLQRVKQQISLDIAQSFLQVVLDQDLVEIARKNLAASQAQQRLLEVSTAAGIRNKADLYQQEAESASDETYFTNTQVQKRQHLLTLLQKLRLDLHKNYRVVRPSLPSDAVANPEYADEKKLIDTAIKNRPDFESRKDIATATHHEVTIAEAPYLPRLDLLFGLDGDARHFDSLYVNGVNVMPTNQRSIGTQLSDQVGWTATLQLSFNIFDRGLTRLQTAQAKITADNADIDAEDREKLVTSDVRKALGDYRASLQTLASSQAGLLAAQKAYDVVRSRYEVGASSFVDLLTAQSALVRAEGARSQAVVGNQLQDIAMKTALGTVRF